MVPPRDVYNRRNLTSMTDLRRLAPRSGRWRRVCRRLAAVPLALLAALAAAPSSSAQEADPKTEFLQALGRFSLDLDGDYGDEGARLAADIEALRQGLARWDAAIARLEAAMAVGLGAADSTQAARMHLALGGVYLDRGRTEDALRQLRAAAERDPTRAEVATLQGLAHSERTGDRAVATEAFRRAAAADPQDPLHLYVLAQHLRRGGETDEARQVLRAFLQAWDRLAGSAAVRDGEIPFVRLGLVQEVAGIAPFFPPVLDPEGFARLGEGAYERAVADFRAAAARDPLVVAAGAHEAALSRAAAAFREGAVPGAIASLTAILAGSPRSAEAHRLLGRVLLADRQHDKAVEALRTAVGLDPGDERARLALADAFVEAGRYEEAEAALEQTIAALPSSGRARDRLARLHQRLGRYPETIRAYQEAIAFHPLLGLNTLYRSVGALYVRQQDFDNGMDLYARRIDLVPNDAQAHQDLGEIYFKTGMDDEALAEFAVALALDPGHAEAHAAMGQVHLRAGRYADAAALSRRALALIPSHQQARYTLATALMRQGLTEEGRQELELFQRLQAEEAAARTRRLDLEGLRREAALNVGARNYAVAVDLLRRALLIEPSAASSHLDLGLALVGAGETAEAIDRLQTAAALGAPADVHRHLATAYAALGRLEDSRREEEAYQRMKQEALGRAGANR